MIAVAFDYVPHPKLLSQPDAVPDELVRQALDTFLSRNQVGSDLVAIALPGQSALAKFIQLPPVESSKVAEIVKYEARQQIPFPLEEVIWDYQTLGSGSEEGGFLLDAEVGLIAMKREQVNHHLKPFLERKIEVEAIQIAPLALYNFLCFDRLGIRRGGETTAGNDYTVLLDMGADNTTLMVTNGRKIWIRNVPVGGNHFTRALTKEMKLTFAKAEHLKCNATKSPDPRAVFQALRPVFNDYVTEIQRSIGYFASVNRQAKIGRLIGCGNGFKLAGLQKFLQQNLQYEVERIDSFQSLAGDHVLHSPLFQDNILTFTVPYGLALQVLGRTTIQTTLLPPEIATARLIRRKKPWAAAAAAALLVGLSLSTAGYGAARESVSEAIFGKFETAADEISKYASTLKSNYDREVGQNSSLKKQGDTLVTGLDTRELWLEVYKAIDECLPRDVGVQLDEADIKKMNRISLKSITAKYYEDLGQWFTGLGITDESDRNALRKTSMDHSSPKDNPVSKTPPSGSGYVFTLQGVHYHDDGDPQTGRGIQYVLATLLSDLQKWEVTKPHPATEEPVTTPVRKLGISHAVIVSGGTAKPIWFVPGGGAGSIVRGGMAARPGVMGPNVGGAIGANFGGGVGPNVGGAVGPRPGGIGANLRGPATGATPARAGRVPLAIGGIPDEDDRPIGSLERLGAMRGAGRMPTTPGLPQTRLPIDEQEDVPESPPGFEIPEQTFTIQFVWKPTPVSQRSETDPLAPKKDEGAPAGQGQTASPEAAKTEDKK
jgi:type IV pilus assembly protein PilM